MLSTIVFPLQSVILVRQAHADINPPPPSPCPPNVICNPIQFTGIADLLSHLLNVLMVFSGAIVVALIVYAGVLYMISMGDPTRRKQATSTLKYALIGFAIIVSARLIVSIISSLIP